MEVTFADTAKLSSTFGYKPRITLKEGISEFVDWYKGYYGDTIIENGYRDLIKSRKPLGSFLESRGCRVSYGCPDPMEDGILDIPMTRDTLDVAKLIYGLQALVRAEKNLAVPQC